MKAKELALILLLDPESEVCVIGDHGGWKKYNRKPRPVKMVLMIGQDEFALGNSGVADGGIDCVIL